MALRFVCDSCGCDMITTKRLHAGEPVVCPSCGTELAVPLDASEVCMYCYQPIPACGDAVPGSVKCPQCGRDNPPAQEHGIIFSVGHASDGGSGPTKRARTQRTIYMSLFTFAFVAVFGGIILAVVWPSFVPPERPAPDTTPIIWGALVLHDVLVVAAVIFLLKARRTAGWYRAGSLPDALVVVLAFVPVISWIILISIDRSVRRNLG